jgi:hypothetical protein
MGVDVSAKPYVIVNGKLAAFEELAGKEKASVSDKLAYVVHDGKLEVVDRSTHGERSVKGQIVTIAEPDTLPRNYFNSIINSKWINGMRFSINLSDSFRNIEFHENYIQALNVGFWRVKVCIMTMNFGLFLDFLCLFTILF